MNILIIAQYFYPDIGGASTRAYNSARALKMQGCDVTVVTAFPHYPHGNIPSEYKRRFIVEEEIGGIRIIRTWIPSLAHSSINNRIKLHLSFIFSSLLAMSRIRKIDIIFAMNPNLFSFYSAIIYRLVFRRKIIKNVDDLWPEAFYDLGIVRSDLIKKPLEFLAKLSYRYSSFLIPVSAGYVKTLVDKYGIPRDKINVIEHGVDLDKFRKIAKGGNQLSNKKIIMYSGALSEGYDFDIIIQAASILEGTPTQFVIRGSGPMYTRILKLAEAQKLSNIEVGNTMLSPEDLNSLLNSADIFILPMNSKGVIDDGLPTKIIEYQALGKPIICISEGEPGRYILRCKSGLVVEPKQPKLLAESILRLVTDEASCKKLGQNGYEHVINNLTFERIGKRLIEVINKALVIN
jgi:glycosyltransferase involved in cell wall biosynthesis